MDWTSWSQIWSTKSTTTTSRRPPETKTEAFALKTNVLAFASRPKAKAKPRRPTSACSSTRTVPICERIWTDIEPGTQSSLSYPVAKKPKTLLRHAQLAREEDGVIEFWRLKDDLRNDFKNSQYLSDEMCGKAKCKEAEAARKDFNVVLSRQDKKFFISELFKVIQDAIPLILHFRLMCLFRTISSSTFIILDVESVYTPSQVLDWCREGKIQAGKDIWYSLRLWIPWTRITKDPYELDLTKPRLASYKQ